MQENIALRYNYGKGFFGGFYQQDLSYLLAPPHLFPFYSQWVRPNDIVWKGYIPSYHNIEKNLVPRKLCQRIGEGITQLLFSGDLSFSAQGVEKLFIEKWSKDKKFLHHITSSYTYAMAAGAGLLKLNRGADGRLWIDSIPMGRFFIDVDGQGRIVKARIWLDVIFKSIGSISGDNGNVYGIAEERYFNDRGEACATYRIFKRNGNIRINDVAIAGSSQSIGFDDIAKQIKDYIKYNYPNLVNGKLLDKEVLLPFKNDLGVRFLKFTEQIGSIPEIPFGECLPSLLFQESLRFDELGQWQADELYFSQTRAMVPETFVNKNDPRGSDNAMNQRTLLVVPSTDGVLQPQPLQWDLRAVAAAQMREVILQDCAMILHLSATDIANFLSSGVRQLTTSEVLSAKGVTESFIQIKQDLIRTPINELLALIMNYEGYKPYEVIFNNNRKSTFDFRAKTYIDLLDRDYITPEIFVRDLFDINEKDAEEVKDLINATKILKIQNAMNAQTQRQENNKTEQVENGQSIKESRAENVSPNIPNRQ